MSAHRQPVNRCAVRACPMLGYWPPGHRCPMHAGDEFDSPRQPSLAEAWHDDIVRGRQS
jgi:hypothetical protein